MNQFKRATDGLRADPEAILKHLGVKYQLNSGGALFGDIFGGEGKSCRLELTGKNQGLIHDFATAEGADLLTLWKNIKGISIIEALKEAKAFLGITDYDQRFEKRSYKKFSANSSQKISQLLPSNEDLISHWLIGRGLSREVIATFEIGARNFNDKWAAVFPHKSLSGELVNCSYRLTDEKKIWQEKDCAPTLFGWHTLSDKEINDGALVICEGHIDALTWRMAGWPSLSLPAGSGMTWVEHDWNCLEVFDRIYLSMDQDEAGRKHFDEIVKRIGRWRCFDVRLPEKDANDVLTKRRDWVETLDAAIGSALDVRPPKIVSLPNIWEDIDAVMNPKQELISEVRHKELSVFGRQEGFIFRKGGVSVWTGYPGHGKSTLLSWILSLDVKAGKRVFVASLEQPSAISGGMFLQQFTGLENLDSDMIRETSNTLRDWLYLFRETGGSDAYEILDSMEYCFHRFGCTVLVIDNLMMLQSEHMDDKWRWQIDWLKKIIQFAQDNDIHVHIVAHPRKVDEDEAPRMFDIFGASQISNLVDNVIAIHRKFTRAGDLNSGDVEVFSRKQRIDGWTGKLKLYFDKGTKSFSVVSYDDITKQISK